jgi:HTH-type transcriptional regulator / antitoxin HigA
MRIKPIKTEADYQDALKEVERLFDAKPGTAEADRLEILTTLIEDY